MARMYSTTYVDDIREIKEENPFESMMSRFDRAAQLLNLDPDLYAVLRVPNRELKVYIPTKMDSGRIQVFEGYRVSVRRQFRRRGLGGVRFTRGKAYQPHHHAHSVPVGRRFSVSGRRPGAGDLPQTLGRRLPPPLRLRHPAS